MTYFAFEPAATAAVVLGLALLGVTRLTSSFTLYGIQTVLIGALAVAIGARRGEWASIIVGVAVAVLKGVGVPLFLSSTAHRIKCHRDTGTVIAPPFQLFLAIAGLALLVLVRPFDGELPLNALPAVGLLLIGMMIMLTRRMAVSQIVGFLVLENGIFLYTIGQPHPMPFLIEIGSLIDVLAGTMLAGLLVFKISHTFEHIDVSRLRELRG